MHLTPEQWIELCKMLIPLIVFAMGTFFKLGQKDRETVAHALDYALRLWKTGAISETEAKSHILATGLVSEAAVKKVMFEIKARESANVNAEYNNHVVPGVAVHVAGDGSVRINPTGLLNKAGDKLEKWFKKKIGRKLF